ncbi:hypothetical protein SAMN05216244_3806 [Sediminibacillus halophilus]|uniref:Uncharacterized protein n=1 Tax=Sediminibacillus halophilus TaxID=482461 RepID=A0A1G9X9F9_9BACI|nr:hypothetical protein SAMN05216244_3806 [Sediminibacillus halophilus]
MKGDLEKFQLINRKIKDCGNLPCYYEKKHYITNGDL